MLNVISHTHHDRKPDFRKIIIYSFDYWKPFSKPDLFTPSVFGFGRFNKLKHFITTLKKWLLLVSSQYSTTGISKAMVCTIVCGMVHIRSGM